MFKILSWFFYLILLGFIVWGIFTYGKKILAGDWSFLPTFGDVSLATGTVPSLGSSTWWNSSGIFTLIPTLPNLPGLPNNAGVPNISDNANNATQENLIDEGVYLENVKDRVGFGNGQNSINVDAVNKCVRAGCGGDLCVSKAGAQNLQIKNCQNKPIYQCFNKAVCEMSPAGRCGFKVNPQFQACLNSFVK
jgi:hypothetical protein